MSKRVKRATLTFLVWGMALGMAYGQPPLYTSNQNQYFLHGFAQAGVGQLSADWLAGTRDPTPLFTLLVRLMTLSPGDSSLPRSPTGTSPALNYLLYLLIFGVYLAAMFGIAHRLFALGRSPTSSLLFLGIIFVTHSAGLRYALSILPGGEWAYLFDGGLGGQRLLGPVFQPSVFGVLLLFSIWLYLEQRAFLAMLATVAAASVHPTYLLSAAVLSGVYWIDLAKRSTKLRKSLLAGAASLALALPIVAYAYANFLPPSAEAQRIMVEFRIPDHAIPAEWFSATALFKLGLIVLALGVARRTCLLPPMLAMLGVGGALTGLQILSDSASLALIFPWRLSATLVPLASAVLAGGLAHRLGSAASKGRSQATGEQSQGTGERTRAAGERTQATRKRSQATREGSRASRAPAHPTGRAEGPGSAVPPAPANAARLLRPRPLRALALGMIVLSVLSGIGWSAVQFVQRQSMPQRGVFEYVRRSLAPGQQYLVPAKMQDFRLATGAPILVDFKSIPYYGPEVLEWHQRVRLLDYFYRGRPADIDCGLLEVFASEYGVTHVVLEPDQRGLECDRLQPLYDDGAYSVHAIVTATPDA